LPPEPTLPDGSVERFDHELFADKNGVVTWSYSVPAGAPSGVYVMAARSSTRAVHGPDVSYDLRFTVQ
jgi:hypothetical protein